MPDILPAPEGLWAIVAIYPDTETITFPGGATSEVGVGVPELCATPVLGFTNREDDEETTFYPLILNSSANLAEPLTPECPWYSLKAFVLANGSPFIPAGLGENVFTLDNLPEEYRFLLASPVSNPMSNYAAPGRYTFARCEDGKVRRVKELMTEEAALSEQRVWDEELESVRHGQTVLRALESHPEGLTEEQIAALTQLDSATVRREVNLFIDHGVVAINDGLVIATTDPGKDTL